MRRSWIEAPSCLLLAVGLLGTAAFGVLALLGLEKAMPDLAAIPIGLGLFGGALGLSLACVVFDHPDPKEEEARLGRMPRSEDLLRLEESVNGKLPPGYRDLMLAFPVRCYRGTCESIVWNDIDEVVKENARLHRGGHPWPASILFIGDDGAGECYALDISGSDPRVHVFCVGHDPGRGEPPDEFVTLAELAGRITERAVEEGIDPDAEFLQPAESRAARLRGCLLAWLTIIGVSVVLGFLLVRLGCS